MRLIQSTLIATLFLAVGVSASAQIVTVTNLGEPPGGNATTPNAQTSFTTGAFGPLELVAATIRVFSTDFGGSGGNANYTLNLLSDNAGTPGSLIASSNVFTRTLGAFGSVEEDAQFDFSGIPLSAGTTYWLDVTANPDLNINQAFRFTGSSNEASAFGWTIGNDLFINDNFVISAPMMISISASAVPEPSTYLLLGMAGAVGAWRLRRKRGQKAVDLVV